MGQKRWSPPDATDWEKDQEKLMRSVNRTRMRIGLPEVLTDGYGNFGKKRR
jgi:hypothetical protein